MDGAHGQTQPPAPTHQYDQPQQISPQVWRRSDGIHLSYKYIESSNSLFYMR